MSHILLSFFEAKLSITTVTKKFTFVVSAENESFPLGKSNTAGTVDIDVVEVELGQLADTFRGLGQKQNTPLGFINRPGIIICSISYVERLGVL